MLKISAEKINELFDKIASQQTLYIPVDREDKQAEYKKYESGMTLSKALNTVRSAKDFFFPQTENLAEFKLSGKTIEVKDIRKENEDFVVFGVRACDAKSFEILDSVFLTEPVDSFYKNRREHGTIVTMACTRPEETCFCTTFGINPTVPGGDASVYFDGESYFFVPFTDKGKAFMASISDMLEDGDVTKLSEVQAKAREIMTRLPLANLTTDSFGGERLMEHFNSEKWAELSEACIGCGTCTFVCPTCQCYDIRDYDTGNGIKRFRCWDSCMYSDFTQMAHGNPRTSQLERFRQRFMHKLVYHPSNHEGEFGCVGCGRCLSKCPVSLNIVKVMKALEDK